MGFFRFLLSTAVAAVGTYFYANWARRQSELQIGKMQMNAYNTPGAESPVTPQVFASGMGALSTVWFIQRRILRSGVATAVLGMLAGAAVGVGVLIYTSSDSE